MDTSKSLRKTEISPSGEIPSCPYNALLEILSRNHARVVPDGFLRDLPVFMPTTCLKLKLEIKLVELQTAFYKVESWRRASLNSGRSESAFFQSSRNLS
jgi:hypothetical protein